MSADPKPSPRVRDPELLRILHASPHKQCAVTGLSGRVEAHHILARSQRGDDVRQNIVLLDADFHARVTRNEPAALVLLGAHIAKERPDTIEYLYRKLGPDAAEEWLRRRLHVYTSGR